MNDAVIEKTQARVRSFVCEKLKDNPSGALAGTTMLAVDLIVKAAINAYEEAQWQEIADQHKAGLWIVGRADVPIDETGKFPGYSGEGSWDEDRQAFVYHSKAPTGELYTVEYAEPTHAQPLPTPPKEKTNG